MDRRRLFAHAFRMGALLAAVKIALLSVAYLAFGVPALVSPATGIVMWVGALGVLILAALRLRAVTGAYHPYTTVLFHLVATWVVGQVLFTGFSIVLFHVLSPGLLEATVEPMREIARQLGQRAKLSPDQIEAHAASITAATSPFSVGGQLRGLRDGLLPGLVLAAIMAIPFRARQGDTAA